MRSRIDTFPKEGVAMTRVGPGSIHPSIQTQRCPSFAHATLLESPSVGGTAPRHGSIAAPPTASQRRPAMVSRWLKLKEVC